MSAAPSAVVNEAVALQAAEWFFLLQSGEATAQDRQRWAQWCAAQPAHATAWQRAQRVGQTFGGLPPALALPVLARPATVRRRAAAKAMAVLLISAPAGWMAWQHRPGQADFRTATGERREVMLADGSRLHLDTASAVDIDFDGAMRLIRLRSGAIHIQTAPDRQAAPRPFVVATAHGRVQALGTRFSVRQDSDHTLVTVQEHAVELRPAQSTAQVTLLQAGQQARMNATQASPAQAADPYADSWTRGILRVRDMRLQDFAAELGRYRPGILRCDPAVADLRISGAFQLGDTTPVLDSLPKALPVDVLYRTRYWVTLVAPGG